MTKRKLVMLDPGHGGLHPSTGKYTTAPGKMAFHENEYMHNGGWFYEGVWNREMVRQIMSEATEPGMQVLSTIPFNRWHEDVPLGERIAYTNLMAQTHDVLFISIHANAFNGKSRGFQVHTSPGDTKSDYYAEYLWQEVGKEVGHQVRMRKDTSDGDADFEDKFQVLTRTTCPAVLVENLFFDNPHDARLLMRRDFREDLAYCYRRLMLHFFRL